MHKALQKGLDAAAAHPYNAALTKGLADAFADLKLALQGYREDMVATFGPPGINIIETFARRSRASR